MVRLFHDSGSHYSGITEDDCLTDAKSTRTSLSTETVSGKVYIIFVVESLLKTFDYFGEVGGQ